MSDKNSSNKQRTFLFNLSYIGGNNQHKNNYEHLELIYQFYASAISNSNFVIENFKRGPRYSGRRIVRTYGGIQITVTTQSTQDQDKDKKEEGDKQKDAKKCQSIRF
jgi:hypothetical protein